MKASYSRFFLMILTSMVVMYALMYFNTYESEHIYWSDTRFFMLLVMGGAMSVVMLSFMLGMYQNKLLNGAIFSGGFLLMALGVYLTRSQVTIGDEAWMKGMIPHHSIAILTSKRAKLQDPRVRKLAREIIEAQEREIYEMVRLLEDIDGKEPSFWQAQEEN